MKILIDNGHGAETRGKRSPDGRLLEYRENRIIARGIVTALAARGWCAHTTRGATRANALATCLYEAARLHLPGMRLRTDYTDADPDLEKDFYVLRHTLCPSVLVENLFMDNPPTAPSSSAKKASNPLLTSMSMAFAIINHKY